MRYWRALQRDDTDTAWEIIMRIETPVRTAGHRFSAGYNGFAQAMIEVYGIAPRCAARGAERDRSGNGGCTRRAASTRHLAMTRSANLR